MGPFGGIDLNVMMILFMAVVLPVWIVFHYGSKRHASHRLTPDDERMLEDLWRSAKAMERRIADLEAIVEPDAPRKRAEDARAADRPSDRVM